MPIIGLKKAEGEKREEKVKLIPKRLIHKSRLVEPEYDKEVMKSVRKVGVIQPLLIRPCLCDLIPEPHFEIFDGHSRHKGIEDSDVELPCVIMNLTDREVLQKMYNLEHKGKKSAFWRANDVAQHVQIVAQRLGNEEGAKAETAKELNISQSLVSQYLKIVKLRIEVQKKDLKLFESLKSLKWGINRLYELARLLDYPSKMVQGINNALKNAHMKIDEVKKMVDWLINPSDYEEKKPKQATTPKPKPPIVEPKPDTFSVVVPSDLKSKVERIYRWIYDEAERELKEAMPARFWVRRNKILKRFWLKRKKTMKDIALACMEMGIEDVSYGRKVYPIFLCFESLDAVPIGFKHIFKERAKKEKRMRAWLERQYRGFSKEKIEELLNPKKQRQRGMENQDWDAQIQKWSLGTQQSITDFQTKEEKRREIKLELAEKEEEKDKNPS